MRPALPLTPTPKTYPYAAVASRAACHTIQTKPPQEASDIRSRAQRRMLTLPAFVPVLFYVAALFSSSASAMHLRGRFSTNKNASEIRPPRALPATFVGAALIAIQNEQGFLSGGPALLEVSETSERDRPVQV